jgi:hypothetical protein
VGIGTVLWRQFLLIQRFLQRCIERHVSELKGKETDGLFNSSLGAGYLPNPSGDWLGKPIETALLKQRRRLLFNALGNGSHALYHLNEVAIVGRFCVRDIPH